MISETSLIGAPMCTDRVNDVSSMFNTSYTFDIFLQVFEFYGLSPSHLLSSELDSHLLKSDDCEVSLIERSGLGSLTY